MSVNPDTGQEQQELAELRSRVRDLEGQLAEARTLPAPAAPGRGRRGLLRATSAVLLVLACVLAPLSVVSVWASTQVSDTDAYVRTMAPLASNPGVQAAVAKEVSDAVLERVQVGELSQQLLSTLAAQPNVPPRVAALLPGLAGPITSGVESFTRDQVGNFVASDEFKTLWAEVNRASHEQVVRLLEGDPDGVVTAQGDSVTLNLAPMIERVKQRLVQRGFTIAQNIPVVDRSFVLVQSDAVTRAQTGYRVLNALGIWLPVVVLALFIGGVLAAGDRRRALLRGSLGVVVAMLLLGLGLLVFRTVYVQSTPANVLTPETAGQVFDTLVRFLRTGLRALAFLGLLLALGAFLSGPSAAATRTREVLTRGIGSARGRAQSHGWNTGPVGVWVHGHRTPLRTVTLVAAGLVLLFWSNPTAWVVLWTAVVVVLVFALVEFLAQPAPAAIPGPGEADTVPIAAGHDGAH